MPNTYQPGNNSNPQGYNPRVDNSVKISKSSGMGKFFIYLSFLLIIPIFIYIGSRNGLLRLQTRINESASGIDIQLAKRRDTLVKLIDSVKGHMKYEKETLKEIVNLRIGNGQSTPAQLNGVAKKLDRVSNDINLTVERYPELQTSGLVKRLQDSIVQVESEISASRRLYNAYVREFNQSLLTYPSNVIASNMGLTSIPLFEASEQQRKDVEVKF